MVSRRGEEGFASGGVWVGSQDAAAMVGGLCPACRPLFSLRQAFTGRVEDLLSCAASRKGAHGHVYGSCKKS